MFRLEKWFLKCGTVMVGCKFMRRFCGVRINRLQDAFIKTNMFALALRLQRTSSRRLGQDQYIRLGYTSSKRLQDVFKTSSRRLAKTSSRRLQDLLQRYLQDVFKMYHHVKLFLLTSLWEVLQRLLSTAGFA